MTATRDNRRGCLGLMAGGILLALVAAGQMGQRSAQTASTPGRGAAESAVVNSDRDRIATANALGAVLAGLWAEVPGVESVGITSVIDGEAYGELVVERDAQTVEMAQALGEIVWQTYGPRMEPQLILDNGVSASEYRWSNVTDAWSITPLTAR